MKDRSKDMLEVSSSGHGDARGSFVRDEYFVRFAGDDIALASDIADTETGQASEANARRIAACWNACAGISTEVLELNATAGGVATLERQRNVALDALNTLILFTKPTKTNAVALHRAISVAGQYSLSGQKTERDTVRYVEACKIAIIDVAMSKRPVDEIRSAIGFELGLMHAEIVSDNSDFIDKHWRPVAARRDALLEALQKLNSQFCAKFDEGLELTDADADLVAEIGIVLAGANNQKPAAGGAS
jgi:hypothetical protein